LEDMENNMEIYKDIEEEKLIEKEGEKKII